MHILLIILLSLSSVMASTLSDDEFATPTAFQWATYFYTAKTDGYTLAPTTSISREELAMAGAIYVRISVCRRGPFSADSMSTHLTRITNCGAVTVSGFGEGTKEHEIEGFFESRIKGLITDNMGALDRVRDKIFGMAPPAEATSFAARADAACDARRAEAGYGGGFGGGAGGGYYRDLEGAAGPPDNYK